MLVPPQRDDYLFLCLQHNTCNAERTNSLSKISFILAECSEIVTADKTPTTWPQSSKYRGPHDSIISKPEYIEIHLKFPLSVTNRFRQAAGPQQVYDNTEDSTVFS